MYGYYVEVVFHFVAKAILFLCFFGFDIMFFTILVNYIIVTILVYNYNYVYIGMAANHKFNYIFSGNQ